MPSKEDLTISAYEVPEEYWLYGKPVRIKRMKQRDGSVKWKVTDGSRTGFRPDVGGFVSERSPSSRQDETLERARFDTPEEALDVYVRWHNQTEFDEQGRIVERATVEPSGS